MENERGITLISVIVYLIVMTFVIAGVSAVVTSMHNNVNMYNLNTKSATDIAKFNMYFVNDLKKEGAQIESEFGTAASSVTISNVDYTTTYSFKDKAIYKDNIKICKADNVTFTATDEGLDTPQTIQVYIKINQEETITTYAVEPKFIYEQGGE